ncbi:hypothetical protein F4818DRAFT_398811 [Hypoxylon cercidicola]|nr:hypothetical protein F4818DRAFT_398811 [Hypoxylon cercidicola]
MSWTRKGAHWSRPLDCHDKLLQAVAASGQPLGREHWLMVGAARVEFPVAADAEGRLRIAWKALRFHHPDIALTLHEDEKCYDPIDNVKTLEEWVSSTFYVDGTAASADDLFSRRLKVASASATCYWIPASNEVAIVSSHWRWDGRGTIMMLHEFLVGLAGNDDPWRTPSSFGDEVNNLIPSLDKLIGMPDVPEEAWIHRANELLAPFQEGSPSIGLPVNTSEVYPGDTRRIESVIPRETTEMLKNACRSRHIRLTAALHASVIVETARYQHPNANSTGQYKSWAAFDLRKYCPVPFNGPRHAPSLRMVALPLISDASADWNSLATSIQLQYQQSFAPEDSDLMFVRVPYVEQATAMIAKATPTTEPNLSNIGMLNEYVQTQYGDVAVRNVWMAVQMLSPQLYLHTWSWNGELHISVCYNEAWYKHDFVEEWLGNLRHTLFTNLDVEDAAWQVM